MAMNNSKPDQKTQVLTKVKHLKQPKDEEDKINIESLIQQ